MRIFLPLSVACLSFMATSPAVAQASRGIEGGCYSLPVSKGGCGPERNSAPSSNSGARGSGSDSSAFGQAINNLNQGLREQERQRQMQEMQAERTANQQRGIEERQRLQEENKRLQIQAEQWRQQQSQSGQASGGGGGGGEKRIQPKVADTTRGCPFLIHTQYGLTHEPGSRYCHEGKALACEISEPLGNGRFRYAWRDSPVSCSRLVSPAVKEGNSANLYRINENFFEEF